MAALEAEIEADRAKASRLREQLRSARARSIFFA